MEILSAKWLSDELEMEDAISNFMYDQYQTKSLDHSLENGYQLNNQQTTTTIESPRPAEMERLIIKNRNWNSCTTTNAKLVSSSSSSTLISFNNSNTSAPASSEKYYGNDLENWSTNLKSKEEPRFKDGTYMIMSTTNTSQLSNKTQNWAPNYEPAGVQSVGSVTTIRSPTHARDHVIAERKRREKLSEKFIALSAVVPGLKKMDKASVLGDAINYVKHLQERVKTLEEQAEKKIHKSVIFVKRYQLSMDDEISLLSDDDTCGNFSNQPLPEIEARVSNKDVLIRIYCEKLKGGCNLANLLTEIEKLHLTIVNTSVLPLGTSTIDITIIAQIMDVEFCMNDLKENLRQALLK